MKSVITRVGFLDAFHGKGAYDHKKIGLLAIELHQIMDVNPLFHYQDMYDPLLSSSSDYIQTDHIHCGMWW